MTWTKTRREIRIRSQHTKTRNFVLVTHTGAPGRAARQSSKPTTRPMTTVLRSDWKRQWQPIFNIIVVKPKKLDPHQEIVPAAEPENTDPRHVGRTNSHCPRFYPVCTCPARLPTALARACDPWRSSCQARVSPPPPSLAIVVAWRCMSEEGPRRIPVQYRIAANHRTPPGTKRQ